MPTKLPFNIASCTGEDPEFPASELLFQSPDSKGWCTPRHCQYPQELTLCLECPVRLTQIQLLSHEFKIAGRLEFVVGTLEGSSASGPAGSAAGAAGKAVWRRLGFLSFDTNEHSSFSARELKSVALSGVHAQLLRIIIHRCHANAANFYGQAGLVAISLTGDPLAPLSPITNTGAPFGVPGPPGMGAMRGTGGASTGMQSPRGFGGAPPPHAQQYAQPAPITQQQQPPQSPAAAAAALAAELGVDSVTAQRIHELQLQKQQAVDKEDYDEAKRVKAAVDRLRAAGGAIAGLEARKLAAVQEEDYDLAKQLKLEIDRMRAQAYASALSGRGGADSRHFPPASRRSSTAGADPAAPQPRGGGRGSAPGGLAAGPAEDVASPPPNAPLPGRTQVAASPDWNAHDERPAQAKGAYSFADADQASLPPSSRRASGAEQPVPRAGASAAASDAGPAPAGFPADLPPPEALSAADAKGAAPLEELLGAYLSRCLYSRTWQLREAALARLAADLEAGKVEGLDGSSDGVRVIAAALLRALKDKVAAVYAASLAAMRALVAAQAASCPPRELQAALADVLPALAEKAAELNQRTREQAVETLVALAAVPEAGLRSATATFTRPPKPGTAWKAVLGRLQLVSALLPELGVAAEGSSEGFALAPLMAFVGQALSNSSAEVRAAAIALTVRVAQQAGPSVQRLLPSDLNPKVKEQIEQGLLNAASAPAPPRPAAPAAAKTPASQSKAKQKAAAPGGKQAVQRQQQAAPPSPPVQQQPPQQQQQQQQQQASAGGGDDEAARYEAEVRSREARLGPNHPDVAEAVCNLAILHNQRGDAAQALPLYERALAVWEATAGPDAPDVAHTLTDIAVIHLEQGRDDLGRPLLERALRIQEARLGAEHPDVAAIRDVLEEAG